MYIEIDDCIINNNFIDILDKNKKVESKCTIITSDILCNSINVGELKYSVADNHTIKFHSLILQQNFRRKGIGTNVVLALREQYNGYIFWGEVLYPLAFYFWKSLENKVDFIDGLEEFSEYECTFSFI